MFAKKVAVLLVGLLIGLAKTHRDEAVKFIESGAAGAPGSSALDKANAAIEHFVPAFLRAEVDKDLKQAEAAGALAAVATAPQAVDYVIGLLKQLQARLGA